MATEARSSKARPLATVPSWGWGATALLAVVIVVTVVVASGGSSIAATMRSAGCTYRDASPFPPKDVAASDYHNDFPTLTARPHWSTFPPSGGGHYRLWATWGFYRRPVNPAMVVHNEEHGGVVIWWGPEVPAATVAELERFYRRQPVGMFGTPITGLGSRIALTAWTADPAWKGDPAFAYRNRHYGLGHVAVCARFDAKAFAAFRRAFRGKSPQGFPLAADRPGCGPTTRC